MSVSVSSPTSLNTTMKNPVPSNTINMVTIIFIALHSFVEGYELILVKSYLLFFMIEYDPPP
ncbi:hypothetical protein BDZ94DRAFT_1260826 [Collybia nuda]|uniref:Uncharacterized protein n=1 Tax=Collybia nuda TaxID=64659 RepID=A0A9P6CJ96_9AGAR|nr:hypothetical protein BDZ94DRAFT_1260826 [Collybia nuda]